MCVYFSEVIEGICAASGVPRWLRGTLPSITYRQADVVVDPTRSSGFQ